MTFSDFCKKLYLHKTGSINAQAWFVQAMFVAGGSNYFHCKPDSTNSYEKKIYQGRAISEQIASSFCPINISGLCEFYKSNLKKECSTQLFNSFSIPSNLEQDFDHFCLALSHQFELFIKNAPNSVDNIVSSEYERILNATANKVSIEKTLWTSADFDNIFKEVPHSAKASTPNTCQLNLYHLNALNNLFTFDNLESFIINNIVSYVHDRTTIENHLADDKIVPLAVKAAGAFQKIEDIDEALLDEELGNILIYIFLEQVLRAPKLYSKIELLASGNEQAASSGGSVHLFTSLDDSLPMHQIVFGKSNIKNDIETAIDNSFDAINSVIKGIKKELLLIENPVLSTRFPVNMAHKLARTLVPKESKENQASNAFGVFLGYSLKLCNINNSDFQKTLTETMQTDIEKHAQYIYDKIHENGLDNYNFYFYFLPFNDAESEKKSVLKNILQGGA